jgi:serine protease AprX
MMRDNLPYINAMKKIFDLNEQLPEKEKIRVISISTGMFSQQPHFEEWKASLKKAEASGILVVTCDPKEFDYGILSLKPGENPDFVKSYTPGLYTSESDALRVPAANKTVASHRGNEVYTFDRTGGMSWGAPYLAGLAALGFQVNPEITPELIIHTLVETATQTNAGPIVNPEAFIERIKGLN